MEKEEIKKIIEEHEKKKAKKGKFAKGLLFGAGAVLVGNIIGG